MPGASEHEGGARSGRLDHQPSRDQRIDEASDLAQRPVEFDAVRSERDALGVVPLWHGVPADDA